MLSVGLCLSARLPAGLLVFLGFVSSFGSIDHRLQQFELLPCGAVQTVDFFDHILNLSEKFLPFLCGMHDDKEEFSAHQLFMLCPLCFAVVIV